MRHPTHLTVGAVPGNDPSRAACRPGRGGAVPFCDVGGLRRPKDAFAGGVPAGRGKRNAAARAGRHQWHDCGQPNRS